MKKKIRIHLWFGKTDSSHGFIYFFMKAVYLAYLVFLFVFGEFQNENLHQVFSKQYA